MSDFKEIKYFYNPSERSDLELKSCPFCGSENVKYAKYECKVGERLGVICLDCLAEIDPGWAQSRSIVQEMWNKKA